MDTVLLEKEKRFSESLLWELQNQLYSQFGPAAWTEKGVPSFVTTNPWIGWRYAQLVLGYLRDGGLNLNEPLYIFDLGAGTGRFAYYFLKEFLNLIKGLPFEAWPIRYVMTDFAESNLTFWQSHPLLKPYFDAGVLDCCLYHSSMSSPELKLAVSKKTVSKGSQIILLANYFFDTIPQDLFRVYKGKLEEGFVTLYTKEKWENPKDPGLIGQLKTEYTYAPVNSEKISGNHALKSILKHFEQTFNSCSFLLPTGAFKTIEYFKQFSEGPLFLIAGDQGFATEEQVRTALEPELALHGSFSAPVSYYAMAKYFEFNNGVSFLTSMPNPSFITFAAIFPGKPSEYPETKQAYEAFIDAFNPCDYWKLGLAAEGANLSLEGLLLLIKQGRFDPMSFNAFFPFIRTAMPQASITLKPTLLTTIENVYEQFYPISISDAGFMTNLGVLCFDLGEYKKALDYFEKALALQGPTPELSNNIQACQSMLKQSLLK